MSLSPLRCMGLLLLGLWLLPGVGAQEKTVAAGSVVYPRTTDAAPAPARASAAGHPTVLFAAVLLAGTGGWFYWRARTAPAGAALRKLSIAETKSLGNRQFLVVACYDDKKFLLGVCPGRIDLLTPLEGRPPAGGSS